jgi:cysteinyl-tRNA synthetase
MQLYNTLNKQIEEIKPLNQPKITIYTCGPTVYDYPHVGNWFTFIRYDLLVRVLKANGLDTKWVMNITDVGHLVSDADEGEDKLEKGARREGKNAWDLAKFYTDYFISGLSRLNFVTPTYLPKATEHIQEQINLIKILEQKGYTYRIDDGIYYDTSKFAKYSDFAQLDIDEQQAGQRISFNRQKRNPSDFALWKFSPHDRKRDMEWDSQYGKGFPGWHLECSAMAIKYLGETIDIHAGGIDHLPVHHTNEIAQSEAATGKTFANYWMHTNHVLVENEKISKSLGNGITLEDIENHGFSLEAFRLHVLESHYQSQSKFSWESIGAAQNRLKNWQSVAALRWQLPDHNVDFFEFDYFEQAVTEYLSDDLNTPEAITTIDSAMHLIEKDLAAKDHHIGFEPFTKYLKLLDSLLGLNLSAIQDISDDQKHLIASREKVRVAKEWSRSDELRNQLETQGIGLRDTPSGAIWFRL